MEREILVEFDGAGNLAKEDTLLITWWSSEVSKEYLLTLVYELIHCLEEKYPIVYCYLSYVDIIETENVGPGYELVISLLPLDEVKRLCMSLELDPTGRRIADIDVLCYLDGEIGKISRSLIPTALA